MTEEIIKCLECGGELRETSNGLECVECGQPYDLHSKMTNGEEETEGEGWEATDKTPVLVDGETVQVEPNKQFGLTLRKIARTHGWTRFRVFVDGEEIESPTDAPENFQGVGEVKLSKYDEAGRE